MCWTPLYINKAQYVLDTTIRKQTRTTQTRHELYYKQLEVNHNGHHTTELRA